MDGLLLLKTARGIEFSDCPKTHEAAVTITDCIADHSLGLRLSHEQMQKLARWCSAWLSEHAPSGPGE